jgi:hypothetical protein
MPKTSPIPNVSAPPRKPRGLPQPCRGLRTSHRSFRGGRPARGPQDRDGRRFCHFPRSLRSLRDLLRRHRGRQASHHRSPQVSHLARGAEDRGHRR